MRRDDTQGLIERLCAVLVQAQVERGCRQCPSSALERFSSLEERRQARRHLTEARDHKERIAAILALLAELGQITETESDRTVFEEMALLLDEIGLSAAAGAAALRALGMRK